VRRIAESSCSFKKIGSKDSRVQGF
jgi:hypothetical protein